MFGILLTFVKKAWLSWAGLFSAIPYGNPYLASAILFVILCIIIVLFQKIEWRPGASKTTDPDEEWLKTWCRVMNIR